MERYAIRKTEGKVFSWFQRLEADSGGFTVDWVPNRADATLFDDKGSAESLMKSLPEFFFGCLTVDSNDSE